MANDDPSTSHYDSSGSETEQVHVHVHVHTPRDPGQRASISHDNDLQSHDDGKRDQNKNGQDDQQKNDDKQDDKGKGKKRNPWPLIILAIVIIVAAIIAFIYWFSTRNLVSTDDAYTDGRAVMIAPHVGGYVTILAVNDNQFVHKGDLLVQIEQKDYIAARDQAKGQATAIEAQIINAQIAVDKARTTYPAQLKQAQGQLTQAEGQLYQATTEYQRQHKVIPAATSQQNIDSSTAGRKQALGQVQQASAQVDEARLITQNIAQAQAQVKQLNGQLEQAQANLLQANINLQYTQIVAPQDGWVTKRNVEMGNYLQSGAQIMAIVTPDLWVTANFKESQLTRMRPGQHVDITVDAYPGLKIGGHIDSVQHGSGAKFTAFPPENATGNYVKIVQRVPVKIVLDGGWDRRYPPPLGLSVKPTVTVE